MEFPNTRANLVKRLNLILVVLLLLAIGTIIWQLWPKPPTYGHVTINPNDSAKIASDARIGFVKYDYEKFVKEFGSAYNDTNRIPVYDTTWVQALLEAFTDTVGTDSGTITLPELVDDVRLNFEGIDSLSKIEYHIGIGLTERFIPPPLRMSRFAVLDTFILDFPPPDTIRTGVNADLLWKVGGGMFILGMLAMGMVL
jgi:hypothetical protein